MDGGTRGHYLLVGDVTKLVTVQCQAGIWRLTYQLPNSHLSHDILSKYLEICKFVNNINK